MTFYREPLSKEEIIGYANIARLNGWLDDWFAEQWEPLEPGTYEFDGGSVIIDDDHYITRTYSLSFNDMVGVRLVPTMPFRLCRRKAKE